MSEQNIFDIVKKFLESAGVEIPTEVQTEQDLLMFVSTTLNNVDSQLMQLNRKSRALRSAKELLEWYFGEHMKG